MGAIVQVDHITWTMDQPMLRKGKYTHPTRQQLLEWGVDGFEIKRLKENNQLPRPIFLSTGTDIHNPLKEWATGWTELLLTPEELKDPNWSVIKKALSEGRTRIWVDHDYYEPFEAKLLNLTKTSLTKRVFAPDVSK
jgi:hypothetical protein